MKRQPSGLPAWLLQRASAVYMLLFLVFTLAWLWHQPVRSHAQWLQWLAPPGLRMALAAFLAALLVHMWVGLRDVVLDYARPAPIRPYVLTAIALVLCGLAAWATRILLGIPS